MPASTNAFTILVVAKLVVYMLLCCAVVRVPTAAHTARYGRRWRVGYAHLQPLQPSLLD